MALRAKVPEKKEKRLKLFMYGPPGTLKTRSAIQFPNSYYIDAEHGTDWYAEEIAAVGSAVLHTTSGDEVIEEVRELAQHPSGYRTIVIDPFTTIYATTVDSCGQKSNNPDVRSWYGDADRIFRRLFNLLVAVDMNVIVTAHAKDLYSSGANSTKIGMTFDGWKRLEYPFDLVIQTSKVGKSCEALVMKTRCPGFALLDKFPWAYETFVEKIGKIVELEATAIELGTPEEITQLKALLSKLTEEQRTSVDQMLGPTDIADLPRERVLKGIAVLSRLAELVI